MPTSIPSRAKVGLGSAAALDACGKPMCIEALEAYPVDWPVSGDRHLYDTLKACYETSTSVDLVWGSAPGWTDPWSRARRLRIVSLGPWSVVVASDDQQWDLRAGEQLRGDAPQRNAVEQRARFRRADHDQVIALNIARPQDLLGDDPMPQLEARGHTGGLRAFRRLAKVL